MNKTPLPMIQMKNRSLIYYKMVAAVMLLLLAGAANTNALYGQDRPVVTRDGETPATPGGHGQNGNHDADSIVTPGNTDTPLLPGNHGQDGNQDADQGSTSPIQQVLNLNPGWNWFSCFIEASDDLMTTLKDSIAETNPFALIKDVIYSTLLQNGTWSSSNLAFNNESMYMVYLTQGTTITLIGPATNPAEHPITLSPGWNWIGFPSDHVISLEEVMAGFTPSQGDLIKDVAYAATFNGVNWGGSLKNLEPGNGYMYYNRGTTKTLTIPSTK